jgi:hypothetical protein
VVDPNLGTEAELVSKARIMRGVHAVLGWRLFLEWTFARIILRLKGTVRGRGPPLARLIQVVAHEIDRGTGNKQSGIRRYYIFTLEV